MRTPRTGLALGALLAVSALWFGCSNAAQQIVKERAIYRRERMVNLRLDAYVLSKFLPLAVVCSAQCLIMLVMCVVSPAHLAGVPMTALVAVGLARAPARKFWLGTGVALLGSLAVAVAVAF